MRDYNFRKNNKKKEQERRKEAYESGYWPTMPCRKEGIGGSSYYLEGGSCRKKQELKRASNRLVRGKNLDEVGSYSNYKKVFDLWWEWF